MRTTRRGFGLDHDSFMTSYKWFNPDIVDALDMNNGLVSPSFGNDTLADLIDDCESVLVDA